MSVNELPEIFRRTYKGSTKSERLDVIRCFEEAGIPVSQDLLRMLHSGAPTYPRDAPFMYFHGGQLVKSTWAPGWPTHADFLVREWEKLQATQIEIDCEVLLGMI